MHQVNSFLGQAVFRHNSEPEKANSLKLSIVGTARNILEAEKEAVMTVRGIFEVLGRTYGASKNPVDLQKYRCELGEPVREYYGRLRTAVAEAGLMPDSKLFNSVMLMHFEAGLPSEIRTKLKPLYKNQISTALEAAIKIESTFDGLKKSNIKAEPLAVVEEVYDKPANNDDKIEQLMLSIAQMSKDMKAWQGNTNYSSENSGSGYEGSNRRPYYTDITRNEHSNRIRCLNCNKPGHSYKICYNANEAKKNEIKQNLSVLLEKQRDDSLNSQGRSQSSSSGSRQ